MNIWIILKLVDMEPGLTLSFIDIIFGDQGLSFLLFLVKYKTRCRLQFVTHENATLVWPHDKPQNWDEHVLISSGHRCTCEHWLAFNHQCLHDLCPDGKLEIVKYSTVG
jgi:hypothetical protein